MSSIISDKKARYWIVVPAAGSGARMGQELPKQYLLLGQKKILEHTLERLLQLAFAQQLLVVLHPSDVYWHSLSLSRDSRIRTVVGGEKRADSVLNALHALAAEATENDWVLVHDAARPCVTLKNIYDLCEQTTTHSVGGILGVPVNDTLKKTDSAHQIINTIDRTQVWQAQTPQIFRYGLLRAALESALAGQQLVTDEASAMEACGYQPLIVPGQSDNIKITHPHDLLLAQWILQQQDQAL